MEVIFSLRQLMGKCRGKGKNLHMLFINLEKTYHRVPRYFIWLDLNKISVPRCYMYAEAVKSEKTTCGEKSELPITRSLDQGELKPLSLC